MKKSTSYVRGYLRLCKRGDAIILDDYIEKKVMTGGSGQPEFDDLALYYIIDTVESPEYHRMVYVVILSVEAIFLYCGVALLLRSRYYRNGRCYLAMGGGVNRRPDGTRARVPRDIAVDPLLGRPLMTETGNFLHDRWYHSMWDGDVAEADRVNASLSADVAEGILFERRGLWITKNFVVRKPNADYEVRALDSVEWVFAAGRMRLPHGKLNLRPCVVLYMSDGYLRIPARGMKEARSIHGVLAGLCGARFAGMTMRFWGRIRGITGGFWRW